jgi:hypothetical protein
MCHIPTINKLSPDKVEIAIAACTCLTCVLFQIVIYFVYASLLLPAQSIDCFTSNLILATWTTIHGHGVMDGWIIG